MADRPIIFSAPMVRALIEGRKTQTRRLLKLAGRPPEYIGPRGCQDDPTCWGWDADGGYITIEGDDKDHLPGWRNGWRDWSGAYAPSDRLYVREAWTARMTHGWTIADARSRMFQEEILYWADGHESDDGWWPSIHMPREFSRLTLTVTEVRVQRLQDITLSDARAEGCDAALALTMPRANGGYSGNSRETFKDLWNSLHGPEAWDANPWVVALTFTVQHGNIDQLSQSPTRGGTGPGPS